MKPLSEWLAHLRSLKIAIWLEKGQLRYRAPKGAMTPELTEELRRRKDEIIAILNPNAISDIPSTPSREHYPLSHAQKRLWILSQMEESSSAYNIPLHQLLEGDLDRNALEEALYYLQARHESLRTTFVAIDGEPRQVIHDAATDYFHYVDLSYEAKAEETARHRGRKESSQIFDLENGPLWKAVLLKLTDKRHVLLFTMHHIISDGVSINILARDLSRHYELIRKNAADLLPPLRIQYRDYAQWQNRLLDSVETATHRRYWLGKLAGTIPVLHLPTDFPRPAIQTFKGKELTFRLERERLKAVLKFARKNQCSLFMVLLAALKTLLFRYTGQEDIIVGSPFAGRHHAGLEDQIGFYINTLPLRDSIYGKDSFTSLLRRVRQTATQAFDHQDYPFDCLVEELRIQRDLSRSPLYDVLLILQNQDDSEFAFEDLQVHLFFEHPETSKYDLSFCCKEQRDGLYISIEFNTDLFLPERIESMGRHLLNLIGSALNEPSLPISLLNLLDDDERRRILCDFNPKKCSFPAPTLVEWFEKQAETTPNRIAVVFEDSTERIEWTYRQLNARANRLAHHLRRLSVQRGTFVGVYLERSPETIAALLGILKAGCAYVPFDAAHPTERLAYMLDDAQAPILITQNDLSDNLSTRNARVLRLDADAELIACESAENPPRLNAPNDTTYVIYTSGSTGQPKGTLVTHANVSRLFTSTEAWFQFNEKDVWTMFHSYAFDFSVWEMWGALLYGGRVVIVPHEIARSPKEFYQLLAREKATMLNQTPSAFRQLMQVEEESPTELSLRLIIFGGEALDMQSLKPWFERHGDAKPQLANMYGITETTVHVTYRPLTAADAQNRASLIGRPLPDLRIYLLDAHRQPVPIGTTGEIYVGGAGISQGYLRRPELTAERFVPDPFGQEGERLYHSGDLGRYRFDGEIEYLGRIDHQVQIRGFRVELGEIESALTAHPAIREAAIVAGEEESGDTYITAYIVINNMESDAQSTSHKNNWRNYLKEKLPDYMIPSFFIELDAMPLTTNGKIDRQALPLPARSREASNAVYTPPQTDLEKKLAALWMDVLNINPIGLHDNFFEIGGHSLKAVRLMHLIQREIECPLVLLDIFREPTIAGLVTIVQRQEKCRREEIPPLELKPAPRWDDAIAPATAEEWEMLHE
ncbi:MAG: amino acid adenylation domain-containing protein [Candidatus Omnitrophota bacterium]